MCQRDQNVSRVLSLKSLALDGLKGLTDLKSLNVVMSLKGVCSIKGLRIR
jgi:hypothetical protein